jgi:hypothetical protein
LAVVKNLWNQLRRGLLGLSPEETTPTRRRFRVARAEMRERIHQIGETFLAGYHAALEHGGSTQLTDTLDSIALELRGFAYEGAAMGLALLDCLTPWPTRRLGHFLAGMGKPHAYMVHVGAGWVWARLKFGLGRTRRAMDPLLVWLAFDGWGFHEGFFRWSKYIGGGTAPRRLLGYERRAFDQGLGRSWWFVNGGDPELIADVVADFETPRQADMWSGVGLAATYAGIVDEPVLDVLCGKAGSFQKQLAQGAVFAAKARQRAGNPNEYTELAVWKLSGLTVAEAAQLCDHELENSPGHSVEPAYELWRQRIQGHFRNRVGMVPSVPHLSK